MSGRRASVVVALVSFLVGAIITALLLQDDGPAVKSPSAGRTGEQVAGATTSSPATPSAGAATTSSTNATPSLPVSTAAPAPRRIALDSKTDFARPFETVGIAGRYRGVDAPTTLRVQVRRGERWTDFPLPVTTASSGTFRAYVELGQSGTYRLRVVDPATDAVSDIFTLLIF